MYNYVHGNNDSDVNRVCNENNHWYLGLKLLIMLLTECISKA